MKILALDYDGVIVDSAIKFFMIGFNAYARTKNGNRKILPCINRLSYESAEIIAKQYPNEISQYYQMRPFCRMATDYGVIFLMIEDHKIVYNQKDFDIYKEKKDFPWKDYYDFFFEEKDKAELINLQKNVMLEPVYPEVIKGCQKLIKENFKVVITSLNIREDIFRYLQSPSIGLEIHWEDIFDHRFGYDKSEQMKRIVDYYHVPYQDIFFVDDQVDHLFVPQKLGVNVFLAGWSYANQIQVHLAREKKIPVINTQENFYFLLKKYIINQ